MSLRGWIGLEVWETCIHHQCVWHTSCMCMKWDFFQLRVEVFLLTVELLCLQLVEMLTRRTVPL